MFAGIKTKADEALHAVLQGAHFLKMRHRVNNNGKAHLTGAFNKLFRGVRHAIGLVRKQFSQKPFFPEIFEKPWAPVSIRVKIFGLISFLVLMLILSGLLLQTTLSDNQNLIRRQSEIIQDLEEIGSTNQAYGQLRWSYMTFLNQPNATTQDKTVSNLLLLRQSVGNFNGIPIEDKIQKLLTHMDSLQNATDAIVASRAVSKDAENFTQQALTDLSEIDRVLSSLGNELRQLLIQTSEETLHKTTALQKIPLIFVIGGLLIMAFVLSVVVSNIFMPVSRITKAMTAASLDTENAKNHTIHVARDDEIGKVTYALNHLLREVSSGIEKIRKTEGQLRETGQYLQTILDNIIDGIIIVDTDNTIVSFNPGAEAILGYRQADIIGEDISEIFLSGKKTQEEILHHIKNAGKSNHRHVPYELNVLHQNQSSIPVELLIGTAIYKEKPMNIVTIRDISVRKQMESLLNQAQRMETLGRMSGGIAHDFNNMLIVISGNLELIERRVKENPELKEMIKDALASVDRGKELTQRILAFSRKQILKPEALNINRRLTGIVELIRKAVREDMAVEVTSAPDLWNIHVDPAQFESALLNLAINARDAVHDCGGKILITVENVTFSQSDERPLYNMKPGDYVMVSVADNGEGISDDIIDRIFDPFFTTKEVGKGTGLGLSMVYGFTKQSDGYVSVTSRIGAGTTISLYFPRSFEEERKVSDVIIAEAFADDIRGNGESVLVVEDKPDVLKFLTTTLRELGYRVTSAKDAASALKRLEGRKKIDALVTDVVMPGAMNGEDLANAVQKIFPEVKVLYISGYTQNALLDHGVLKSNVNLLAKPFTSIDLARSLRNILESIA